MSIMDCGDEVFRIKEQVTSITDVLWGNRIHVMDDDSAKYLPTLNAEVAAFISCDDRISDMPPLRRAIEKLIHVAVKSKSLFADFTI